MDEDGWRDGNRAKGRGELVGEETEMKGLTETQREMRERERERVEGSSDEDCVQISGTRLLISLTHQPRS